MVATNDHLRIPRVVVEWVEVDLLSTRCGDYRSTAAADVLCHADLGVSIRQISLATDCWTTPTIWYAPVAPTG
jgi:hypothetical protein